MFFHKVSGSIPENKHKEFEQTFNIIGTELPQGCSAIEFSNDIKDRDRYHFTSFWEELEAMKKFSHSSSNMVLLGAFKALGTVYEDKMGVMIEIS